MTWTKLSDDFADDCERVGLSPRAAWAHVQGLLWTMRRETGGVLDDIDVRRAIREPDAIAELVAVGFWETRPTGGYVIRHHMEHQPEPDVLAKRREITAERVRKHRRQRAGLGP